MLHAFQLLFVDCNYPKAFVWWIGMHAVMFFFLFKEFYKQSYNGKRVRVNISNSHRSLAYSLVKSYFDETNAKLELCFTMHHFFHLFRPQNSLRNFAICFLQRTDHSKSNGSVKSSKKSDDADSNGHVSNGVSNKASDYYIKSEELTSNLTQRRLAQDQEQ